MGLSSQVLWMDDDTCDLTPMLSWTILREKEQLMAKHWNTAPMALHKPRASSS